MKTAHFLVFLLIMLEGIGFSDASPSTYQVAGFFPRSAVFSRNSRMKLKNRRLLEIKKSEKRKQERVFWVQRIEFLAGFLGEDSKSRGDQLLFICWKLGRELSLCPFTHREPEFLSLLSQKVKIPEDLLRKYMVFSSSFDRVSPSLNWKAYEELLKIQDKEERLYYHHAAHVHSWNVQVLHEQIQKEGYKFVNSEERKKVMKTFIVLIDPGQMAEEFIKNSENQVRFSLMNKIIRTDDFYEVLDADTDPDPPVVYHV